MPALDALEAGRRVDTGTMHAALQSLFHPTVQGFLIVQGGRDLQVSTADAARLKQAAPESTLVLLPTANHVLKTVDTDDRAANAATYADPARPLAPGVVDAIADFIAPTRPAAPASAAAS